MEWIQFIEIILIPAFLWLVYRVGCLEKELANFKVKAAEDSKAYTTKDDFLRMESKIDDLRNLVIEAFRITKKAKK